MGPWVRRALRFYFAPTDATDLAFCRVAFFGLLFLFYLPVQWSDWTQVSTGLWFPIPLFETIQPPVASAAALSTLGVAWKCALLGAALGLFTRSSAAFALCGGIVLLGMPHNYGKTHHADAVVVLIFSVFAISWAGRAFSLDERIRRALGRPPTPTTSPEYTWPLRVIQTLLAIVYAAAGWAKVDRSGFGWVFSENMENILKLHFFIGNDPPIPIGFSIAQLSWLPPILAAGTIALELALPLAVFSRYARLVLILHLICLVFWVPWRDLLARLRR
jgi:hypothetical protein